MEPRAITDGEIDVLVSQYQEAMARYEEAAGFEDAEGVTAYVAGLGDQHEYWAEFADIAGTWRGPATELKRAILSLEKR